jgi:hypothetical protein
VKTLLNLALFSLMFSWAGCANATAQQADILIVDGEEQALFTNPLDVWLRQNPDVESNNLPDYGDDDGLNRPADIGADDIICIFSSGNWRGYTATFAIENRRFLLKKVEFTGCSYQEDEILPRLFKGKKKALADWFSGILVVPTGDIVDYVHLGYGSLYSEYRLFRIEGGRVVDETKMNAEQYGEYRQRQFAIYKQTAPYFQSFADLSKDDAEDMIDLESFLYNVKTDYTSDIMLPFK